MPGDERQAFSSYGLLVLLALFAPLLAGLLGTVLLFAGFSLHEWGKPRLGEMFTAFWVLLLSISIVVSYISALYTIIPAYFAMRFQLRRTDWSLQRIQFVTALIAAVLSIFVPIALETIDNKLMDLRGLIHNDPALLFVALFAHVISIFLAVWLTLKLYGAVRNRIAAASEQGNA